MMKRIFSAAIACAIMLGFTAYAQTPEKCDKECQKTECPAKDKKHGDKKGQKADFKKGPHKGHFNPFEGIELTAEQKAQLEALRAERHNAPEMKAESREARREQGKARMEEFKGKVKEILTPEQFAQFEQNLSKADNRPEGNKQMGDRKPGKKMHADKAKCDKACDKKCDKANCDKANCDKPCDKAKCDKAKCDKANCDKAKCDKANCDKK